MPEEQAFSVLVKIMFDYGLRELFKQNFEDLHCKFYQLERLMQVRELRLGWTDRCKLWQIDWGTMAFIAVVSYYAMRMQRSNSAGNLICLSWVFSRRKKPKSKSLSQALFYSKCREEMFPGATKVVC